ncbi:response regulator transcription factor [candidate division KSB1 bacterium]|nr:response regulator transcription factor [candidate division KSB1 bacterium]
MSENRKSQILLVEDEDSLAVGLEYNLTHEGYEVTRAKDGKIALDLIHTQTFDLIILDIMLPFYNGFELAEIIRGKSQQIPILMLTARTAAKDRVKGLELGADDYLAKPFHLKELLLRVKGMLRRKQWYQDQSEVAHLFRFGANEINFDTLVCKTPKQEIRLTPHEAMVLKYLILHKGKIVSRKELLEKVWNVSSEIETRSVDIFIGRLRKYFELEPASPVFIKSIRGAGYQFSDE